MLDQDLRLRQLRLLLDHVNNSLVTQASCHHQYSYHCIYLQDCQHPAAMESAASPVQGWFSALVSSARLSAHHAAMETAESLAILQDKQHIIVIFN